MRNNHGFVQSVRTLHPQVMQYIPSMARTLQFGSTLQLGMHNRSGSLLHSYHEPSNLYMEKAIQNYTSSGNISKNIELHV